MHIRTVLFPTDFSELNGPALHYATSLARDSDARLLIVHVAEPLSAYGGGGDAFYAIPPDDEALRQRLEEVLPDDPAVPCEHRLLSGDPAHQIVHLAKQENADLIVMGTHGRTGLMRLVMGSVAEAVVRRAPCPVFTVRQPQHVAAS